MDDRLPLGRVEVVVELEAVERLAVGRGGRAPAVVRLQVGGDGGVGRPPVQVCGTHRVAASRIEMRRRHADRVCGDCKPA